MPANQGSSSRLKQPANSANHFSVSDLHLAVFIKTKYRFPLVDMKKSGGRVSFIFDTGDKDAQDLLRSFYGGDDLVSARLFVQELRDLKALLHNY